MASPVDGPATRMHLQPGVNIPQVHIDGVRADDKRGSDLFLRVFLGEELEDLAQSASKISGGSSKTDCRLPEEAFLTKCRPPVRIASTALAGRGASELRLLTGGYEHTDSVGARRGLPANDLIRQADRSIAFRRAAY